MSNWDTNEAFNILMNSEETFGGLVHAAVTNPQDFFVCARELVDDMEDVDSDRVDFQQLWADVRNMD